MQHEGSIWAPWFLRVINSKLNCDRNDLHSYIKIKAKAKIYHVNRVILISAMKSKIFCLPMFSIQSNLFPEIFIYHLQFQYTDIKS